MSETVYLLTLCLPLATILIVLGMKHFAAILQARASLAREGALREIATQAAAAESQTAAALSSIGTTLADVRARLATIEKILQQVE